MNESESTKQSDKAKHPLILSRVKMEHPLKIMHRKWNI
jgi:hypothetical protein